MLESEVFIAIAKDNTSCSSNSSNSTSGKRSDNSSKTNNKTHANTHHNSSHNSNNRRKLHHHSHHHHHHHNNNNNNNNSNHHNNNNSSYSSGNRKKFYHQNNNNNSTKNQNICLTTKNAHNLTTAPSTSPPTSSVQRSKLVRHLKSIDCNTNGGGNDKSIKVQTTPLQISLVMSDVSHPAIDQQKVVNVTTTASAASSTSKSHSTSAPVSPNSYSLDFLHTVGVQMTAGGAVPRSYNSPTISPSRHGSYQAYTPLTRNHNRNQPHQQQHIYNQENSPILVATTDGQHFGSNTNQRMKEHGFDIPILVHHPFPRGGLVNSPTFYHSHHTFHHGHGYHHPSSSYYHPAHYHNHNGSNISNSSNNNHNHSAINRHNHQQQHNSHNYHQAPPHHSQQQPKKVWNSYNNHNSYKKSYNSSNAPPASKSSSGNAIAATTASTASSTSSVNIVTSQTLPRATSSSSKSHHQNFRNLTYVTTDATVTHSHGHHHSHHHASSVGNSRSPTPSPKSESPSLLRPSHSGSVSDASDPDHLHAESLSTSANTTNGNASSFAGNSLVNGYESDSSHSSCNKANATPVSHNHHQITEITSLLNFPTTCSEEDLTSHIHYYGNQQSLSYWNPSYHSTNFCSLATSVSENGGNGNQSDATGKRGSVNHRMPTYRGRRYMNANIRSLHLPQDYLTPITTPVDRFLSRSRLIEVKEAPETLLNGSKWDNLSRDVWNRFINAQQTESTYIKKMQLWRYLYLHVKKVNPRYGLYLVGSTISGFGADTSDVDMCLVSRVASANDPRLEALVNLNVLRTNLSVLSGFDDFNVIEAKVPILRFRDRVHMLEVDLNYNNCVGIKNTHLLYCYSQLDWRLRPLVLVTKLWAQYHDINNAKNMTISSYSLVLMVIHFLQFAVKPQVLPCLHEMYPEKFPIILKSNEFGYVDMNEYMGPYKSENTQTLGELFLEFLEYYSNFDYSQFAISIRTGSLLSIDYCRQVKSLKNDIHQWKELCIEEPFDLTNTARSVYDSETFDRVKAVITTSWKVLRETLDLNSVFNPIPIEITPRNATTSPAPVSLPTTEQPFEC